ncbi:hypothetical protein JTB14_002109 [Gonioctena quinquepunctata]|nr:hypothetical protein JTB14_002109 [Gonioctena quinquepunctata]
MKVAFHDKVANVLMDNKIVLQDNRVGNLFVFKLRIRQRHEVNLVSELSEMWHKRMGHSSKFPVNGVCEICLRGKQSSHRCLKSLPLEKKAKRVLDCVSSDVCGKISPPTHDGHRYVVPFIDNSRNFGVVYLMKNKNYVGACLRKYVAMTEANYSTKGEYVSTKLC